MLHISLCISFLAMSNRSLVTTAWCVLRLQSEDSASKIQRTDANVLNKQLWTAKGVLLHLGVGSRYNNF